MVENELSTVTEDDQYPENCEIMIELSSPQNEENCNDSDNDILEMHTRLKLPKTNNQFVTLLLLFLVTISSIFTLLKNVYDSSATSVPTPMISSLEVSNYTMLNDTIESFIYH